MLNAKSRLRDMRVYSSAVKDINHAGLIAEVQHALTKWGGGPGCVLIGGLALSFYCSPRYTQDVALLFLQESKIPDSHPGFKKLRSHSFQETDTHVEVETLSPEYLNLPAGLAAKVFATAVKHGDWLVASREGLIALKLQRAILQDLADIEGLMLPSTHMDGWHLTTQQLATFQSVKENKN